jgi:phospholipid/cholesterol/gamma-HCH transport system substrate-binding protein
VYDGGEAVSNHAVRPTLVKVMTSPWLLVVAIAAAAIVGTAFLFSGSSHEVTARFADANGLVTGNEVRVAGIEAGTVKSVDARVDPKTGQQYAEAVLDIQDAHWPLHQGTTLEVRPKGVLSNVFVALDPGARNNPTMDPTHVFGLNETSSPINLDTLNDVFSADVRESMRTQIQEGVLAFGGTGADNFNATVQNLNPMTANLVPLTQVLADRSPELDRLNTEFDTITHELSSEDANLRGLLSNGNVVLGVLATKNVQLQGVLVHAGGTLASIDAGLAGEEKNLQRIFELGPSSLDKTKRTNDLLNPLLTTLNPHFPDLNILLHQFVSATGYVVAPNAVNKLPSGLTCNGVPGICTTRVDAFLGGLPTDPQGRTAVGCGGEPVEQTSCPPANRPKTSSGSATPSGSTQASYGSAQGSYEWWSTVFGGLFG